MVKPTALNLWSTCKGKLAPPLIELLPHTLGKACPTPSPCPRELALPLALEELSQWPGLTNSAATQAHIQGTPQYLPLWTTGVCEGMLRNYSCRISVTPGNSKKSERNVGGGPVFVVGQGQRPWTSPMTQWIFASKTVWTEGCTVIHSSFPVPLG